MVYRVSHWFRGIITCLPTISTFAVLRLSAYPYLAPSSELVHFRHRIGEEGVELILKESIHINLAMEGSKKEEDDRNKGKDGRGRSRLSLPSSNSLPAPLSKLA